MRRYEVESRVRNVSSRWRRRVGAVAACAALALVVTGDARALGGDDVNTGTKVNAATQLCQATIAKGGTTYAQKVSLAMNGCLDALVKCDEQADAAKALTCRRALLVPITGKCSVGKVDEGASLLSTGAAAHAASLPLSKAALIREMNKYTTAIQKKCFDVAGVDLGSALQGLGFSPTPADKLAVADATNQDPGGVQCLANGLVLQTHPLADDMTDLLETLHETCVVADVPGDLSIACSVNADCGPTKGRCGALAKVFQQGSIKECASSGPVVAVCGNGTAESPEQCDDGNLSAGDGCSATCDLEVARHFPATGQTTCWSHSGSVISCPGTGHDGDIQAGATLAYVDNGDGTITDVNTGSCGRSCRTTGASTTRTTPTPGALRFAVKTVTLNCGRRLRGLHRLAGAERQGAAEHRELRDPVPGADRRGSLQHGVLSLLHGDDV